MIKNKFPDADEALELKGFLTAPFIFCRIFEVSNSIEDVMKVISEFLIQNGYKGVEAKDLDESLSYENLDETVSISPHGYMESLVLFITNKEIEAQYFTNDGDK
jgi:hypothetical protein